MLKNYLKSLLLLLCMIVGAGTAWAEETPFYTLDGSNTTGGNSNYAQDGGGLTQGDISWSVTGNTTVNPWRIGGKNLTDVNREAYSETAMGAAISKVDLEIGAITLTKVNSITLIVASNSDFSNVIETIVKTSITANTTLTFEPSGSEWAKDAYYKLVFNVTAGSSNSYIQLKSAKFYQATGSLSPLTSIALSGTYPTSFYVGDAFSHEGMTITATYEDESNKDVTGKAVFSGYDMSKAGNQTVTVSYTENTITKTAEYNIIVSERPKYTVTFSDGGSVTQASYGAEVTLPSREGIGDYTFAGWSETNVAVETTTAPTIIPAGSYTPATNITLYPVYTRTEGGGAIVDEWVEIFEAPADGYYAICSDDYFMKASTASNRFSNGTATPNISNGKLAVAPADDCIWNIYKADSYYRIKYENSFAAATGSNNQGKFVTDESDNYAKWTITYSNGFVIENVGMASANKNKTLRNNGTYGWASYGATTGKAPRLFKKISQASSTTYYFSSPVAAAVERPVITFAENPFLFSTTATITCTTDGAKIYYSYDNKTWNEYTDALNITATTTIYAKATKGDDESTVASMTATKNLAEPTVAISGDLTLDLNGETNVEAGTLTAAVTYNEAAVDGATVTWSGNNDAVATINATTGAVTILARGEVTFTATYAGNSDYAEATATKTITVIDSKAPGTEGRPYTVAEAIDAIDNDGDVTDVYVRGIVCTGGSNLNSGALNYWISDDGTETGRFEIYKGKCIGGANFTATSDIQVGDVVVVRGNIVLFGASTYEFSAGSQLVSLERKGDAGLSYETTAYYVTVGGTFDAPALTNPHDLTVTYSSSDTEVATVNAETGEVTLGSKVGTTTITASFAGNGEYNAASASYTLTVEYPATTTTLNKTAVELDLADDVPTATLVATVKQGEDVIENATITWTSDNEEVATVDNNGVVTAVAKGTATITATFSADGYKTSTATCEVTVINTASGVIDLAKTGKIVINEFPSLGGSGYTSVNPYVINGADWKADNCMISGGFQLRKNDGVLTSPVIKSNKGFTVSVELLNNTVIISDGTNSSEEGSLTVNEKSAQITISAGSVYAKIASITITPIKDNRTLAFSEPTTEILVNGTATNTATATPAGTITYTSSDETVATVDAEGKVTGVKIGTATITATVAEDADYNEATASYEVTVNGIPAATDIALTATDENEESVALNEIKVGTIGTFAATYTKAAANVTVTYTSDATDVLTIEDNMFRAVKGGTANVTVTITPDDADHYVAVSKEFEVTVLNAQKGTTVLTLYDGELEETAAGSTLYGTNISLIAELANQYDGEVTASLTNDAIANVAIEGENITITPKAVGTTTITFTAPETANFEGKVTKTYALTVTAPEGQTACVVTPAEVVLNETFSKCDSHGGNDGDFGTSSSTLISSPSSATDVEGWTLTKAYEASGCVKLGSSKDAGSATTPLLSVSAGKTYTLTFNAAPWSAESATMTVSVNGGTINGEGTVTTATMTTGKWNSFEYNILATAAEMKIEFTCSQTRFFLDDVKIEIPEVAPAIPDVTIAESGYASFCCEYPLDFTEANENYKAWYVSEVSGTTVTFKQIKGKIAGGVPFFLYGEPGTYHLQVAAESTETLSGNMLVGTLAPTYVKSEVGDYTNFGLSGGSFKKMNTGVVKANKAYLPILTDNIPAGARLNIIFDEEDTPTGISSVNNENFNQRKDVYNLNGQRVENMKKGGLYIVNGKKVFMKGQR